MTSLGLSSSDHARGFPSNDSVQDSKPIQRYDSQNFLRLASGPVFNCRGSSALSLSSKAWRTPDLSQTCSVMDSGMDVKSLMACDDGRCWEQKPGEQVIDAPLAVVNALLTISQNNWSSGRQPLKKHQSADPMQYQYER